MPIARIEGKILFFAHIPKTAGASVEVYLASKGKIALKFPYRLGWSNTTAQHMHAEIHRKLVPEAFCDQSFTIVRDPMARLMSEYNYRLDRGEARGGFDDWARRRLMLVQIDPMADDNHLRPQTDFLRWNMVIFRFEHGLDPVYDWIDKITATEQGDRSARKNASSHRDLSPGADIVEMVHKVYAADYRLMAALDAAKKFPVRYKTIRDQIERSVSPSDT